ncbi:MAG: isoprenylcysteine carboxylmethyltransferase family protein [Rhodothermales bacterium]
MKSTLLVLIQFASLAGLALAGPPVPQTLGALGLFGAGLTLGLWAVAAMRLGNLHIRPDVAASATLTTRGPYRLIRHPMYAALLLVGLGWLVDAFSLLRLALFLVLLCNLLIKLHYEESLLTAQLEGYTAYRVDTWRLIPWLY